MHINSSKEQKGPESDSQQSSGYTYPEKLSFNRITNLLLQDINLKPLSDIELKDLKTGWI